MKKLVSFFIIVIMLVSILPVTVLASPRLHDEMMRTPPDEFTPEALLASDLGRDGGTGGGYTWFGNAADGIQTQYHASYKAMWLVMPALHALTGRKGMGSSAAR
jgi:hypothetical protein